MEKEKLWTRLQKIKMFLKDLVDVRQIGVSKNEGKDLFRVSNLRTK